MSARADGFDILVTPTLGETPPKIGEHDNNPMSNGTGTQGCGWIPFTPFNKPAAPSWFAAPRRWQRTSRGVQFVADCGRDDLLIGLAAQLEHAPWGHIEA